MIFSIIIIRSSRHLLSLAGPSLSLSIYLIRSEKINYFRYCYMYNLC